MSELYNQRPYVGPILKKPRLSPCVSHSMPGSSHNDDGGKRLMSFKEFILSQSNAINEQEALARYMDYKTDFTRRQIDKFFKEHHEEDWFRNKLQPLVTSTATTPLNTTSTAIGLHPTTNNSSLFKDPSTILNSLSDDVTSMIKNEVHNHRAHNHYTNTNIGNEPPILTLRQTQTICEKLIREREQRLREEYDKILINKLAEQYDTFVKYTHDHIEKRYNESNSHQASYLS